MNYRIATEEEKSTVNLKCYREGGQWEKNSTSDMTNYISDLCYFNKNFEDV